MELFRANQARAHDPYGVCPDKLTPQRDLTSRLNMQTP